MKALSKALATVLLCGAALAEDSPMATITVAPSRVLGPVKPVNGVGQPPMVGVLKDWSMFHYLKEAGIPYSRLHDVGGRLGGGVFVDIPNLFPDFDADETDPANYRFAFTDSLMKALEENGVEPFFRLGVSIENWVFYGKGLPALRTKPPKDFAKWARICEHVIRHYTEGWADGFQMKVEYWEIWNEPEGASMFGGPFEEYVRLYGVVASYLKGCFPHLKIGGYGSCGFYGGVDAEFVGAANIAPNLKLYIECANRFLAAARDNGWPLDFFSFHSYSAPKDALRQVRYADRLLDEYGFTHDKTERIFNEWLPFPTLESLGTAAQAAAIAAELIALQNGPCDLACIYDARCGTGSYSALFNPLTQKPHKAYYAFVAFNELRKRGTAVQVNVNHERHETHETIYAAAALSPLPSNLSPLPSPLALMLANPGSKEVPFSLDIGGDSSILHSSFAIRHSQEAAPSASARCRITDETRTWAEIPLPAALPPHSFIVVEFQ